MRITRKKKIIAAGIVAAGLIGGSAVAYWTQSGSGSGSAATGTTTSITVVQDSTVSGLYPGGSPVALSGHFVSANPGSVNVSSVTASVHAFSAQADNTKPACTAADFAIGGSSGPYTVPNGSATTWSGLTVRLLDTAANQDNCKSVNIDIDYVANA